MKIEVKIEDAKDIANLVVQFKKCVLENIKGEEVLALYNSLDKCLQLRQRIIDEANKPPPAKKKRVKKVKKVEDADNRQQQNG